MLLNSCNRGQRVDFSDLSRLQYFAREAAAALLKMAKTTSNPEVAAGLVQRAADLKDRAGELPETEPGAIAGPPTKS